MAGSGKPELCRDRDFARELGEELGLDRVLPPLRCMMFLNCECPAMVLILASVAVT